MIKIVFAVSFSLVSIVVMAQLPKGRVSEANKIPIEGKESLGALVKIDGFHSYLFLKDCHQRQDSLGMWRTDFEFGNPNRIIAYDIMIVLQFDHSTDSVIFTTDGIPKNVKATHGPNNLGASYSATELSANATITATVVSTEKVFTTIVGVEGQLN